MRGSANAVCYRAATVRGSVLPQAANPQWERFQQVVRSCPFLPPSPSCCRSQPCRRLLRRWQSTHRERWPWGDLQLWSNRRSRGIRSSTSFDLFASADTAHVDELVRVGKLRAEKPRDLWARPAASPDSSRNRSDTGNSDDAAFTAYSLVLNEEGKVLRMDGKLHSPLDQALGISRRPAWCGYGYLPRSVARVK